MELFSKNVPLWFREASHQPSSFTGCLFLAGGLA
jgi:hypothetical protein